MSEKESRTERIYTFNSGRRLEESPAEQSLDMFLREFSEEVLNELDKSGLVIVGGESGLGKTELFLGQMLKDVSAGGIAEVLRQKGRTFVYVSTQGHSIARMAEEVIGTKPDKKPEVVLVDEAGVMIDSKDIDFGVIKRLLDDGRKVVLVGGGHRRASEQSKAIRKGLAKKRIKVNDQQMFEFPARTLNDQQSVELLISINPDWEENVAIQIVSGLNM